MLPEDQIVFIISGVIIFGFVVVVLIVHVVNLLQDGE